MTPGHRKTKRARKPADYRGGLWGHGFTQRLRDLKGGTGVRRFAKQVGLSSSLVSSYLSGGRLPDALSLHKIAESTNVSLDWLLCGEGGADVHYRGQARTPAVLAADVAAYVRRGVAQHLADTHPNLAPEIDAEWLLNQMTRLTARAYGRWADRIAAMAEALMPVTELAIHTQTLAETLAPRMTPLAVSEIRLRTEKCVDRAFDVVSSLPHRIASLAPNRPDPFFPGPTVADYNGIIERRALAVRNPWVLPEDRAQAATTPSGP
jgi:transcriptional regulator with XRE-family HTH domain